MNLFLLIGCEKPAFRPADTPVQALFTNAINAEVPKNFVLLKEQLVTNGLVMVYKTDNNCISTAFVSKEKDGWLQQSTGSMCDFQGLQYAVAHGIGGNIIPLTIIYGFAARDASHFELLWNDGTKSEGDVTGKDKTVLSIRYETILAQSITFYDAQNQVVGGGEFSGDRLDYRAK